MMACADDHGNVSHSSLTSTNTLITPIFTPDYTNLFSPNHHPAYVSHEESRRILKKKPLATTSRWNPTTEQLLALEELYRRGARTPTAEQIQQIAAYLRRFGRIEEKNVFYWFQNHKARDRQKRRRTEMASLHLQDQQQQHHMMRRTGSEVKHTKKWAPLLDCCILMEESANSMHRAAIAERETIRSTVVGRHHGTWQSIQMPCPPLPSIQTMTTTLSDTNLSNTSYHYGMLFTPTKEDQIIRRESITLNLFPALHGGYESSDHGNCITREDTKELPIPITRDQFFEFLPLKN